MAGPDDPRDDELNGEPADAERGEPAERDDADGGPAADQIAELAVLPVGPTLLTALTALDVDGLDAHDTVVVIAAWERLMRYSSAAQLTVIARLPECDEYQFCSAPQKDVERPHAHDAVDPAGDELSLALTVSPAAAKNLIVCAQELVTELPDTLRAVAEGGVDAQRARLVCERTRVLDSVRRREVESVVLPAAPGLTYVQLDRRLRRAVIAADPEGAEARRRHAHVDRRVEAPRPDALDARDGMARMQVVGPAEDLVALYTAVDAAARHQRASGDPRTLDQLRFDTLTGVGWNALDLGHLGCCRPACANGAEPGLPVASSASSGASASASATSDASDLPEPGVQGGPEREWRLGRRHGRAAVVNVTVPVSNLLGTGGTGGTGEPAELEGYGPITREAASRVARYADVLHRMLTDDRGQPLSYARRVYRPPPELAEHVVVRDRTCRFPTCAAPARLGDLGHRVPWTQGGTTDSGNVWALHKGHHLGKTHHRFRVAQDPATGETYWIKPAGHTYPRGLRRHERDPAATQRRQRRPTYWRRPIGWHRLARRSGPAAALLTLGVRGRRRR